MVKEKINTVDVGLALGGKEYFDKQFVSRDPGQLPPQIKQRV